MNRVLRDLVNLSRELGKEERQLAMLGEGNTGAVVGPGSFLVKASGTRMGRVGPRNFLKIRTAAVLKLLVRKGLTDAQVMEGLRRTVVGRTAGLPSTETFLHALCLTIGEARWVGHTHPVGVNGILCSQHGAKPFLKGVFPDAIVYCGQHPAVVPYVDPGVQLALALRRELVRFKAAHGYPPRLVLLVNHGMVALGQTADEVLNITLMAEKWAGILIGTFALAGPRHLTRRAAAHIDAWPAEHYRRRLLTFAKR